MIMVMAWLNRVYPWIQVLGAVRNVPRVMVHTLSGRQSFFGGTIRNFMGNAIYFGP